MDKPKKKRVISEEQKQALRDRAKMMREKKKESAEKLKEEGKDPKKKYNTSSTLKKKVEEIEKIDLSSISGIQDIQNIKSKAIDLEDKVNSISNFIKEMAEKEKQHKEPIKLEIDEPVNINKDIELNIEESEKIPNYKEPITITIPPPKNAFDPSKMIRGISSLKIDNNMRSIYKGANIRNNDNPYKNKYKKK